MIIGVVALQGDVEEHVQRLQGKGVSCRLVRKPAQLEGVGGLVVPGGESTAMRRLIASSGLEVPVRDMILAGMPVWGTCAGVIVLSKGGPWHCIDVDVARNAYGSQIASRIVWARTALGKGEVPLVFIRAPRILAYPPDAKVLCRVQGDVVALKRRNVLLTTFHPELADTEPFTDEFLCMVHGTPHPSHTRHTEISRG